MDLSQLRGIFTPIVTPIDENERVDVPSLRRLVDFLVRQGVQGIWAMGTTGEFAAFPPDERRKAIEAAVEASAKRVPVVANVGDSSTGLAIGHARAAAAAGADALALTVPHYFPHSMDEAVEHFRAVKAAADLPLLVYNIPSTVKVKMTVEATVLLAREGTVQGIKDSQNDLQWFRNLALSIRAAGLDERFRLFLGTRTLIDAGMAIGAHGAVPSVSNIAPAATVRTYMEAAKGDFIGAARAQETVIKYDRLSEVARAGSENAAVLSMLKNVLQTWGVIDHPFLTRPLRPFVESEVADLRGRLQVLETATAPPALAR